MAKGEFAVIGTGEVPCGIYPDRSEFEIAYKVAKLAIEDAGIDKNKIGAVISSSHLMSKKTNDFNIEMTFGRLPEALGLKGCKGNYFATAGGSSTYATMKMAEGILHSGEADYVLVFHAQRFSQFSPNDQSNFFASAGCDNEFEMPYGMTYNSLCAMLTNSYMEYTGTTIEQIASVTVACRKWSMLQKNAMFNKKEVTVEEVLKSKMIAYPLTAFMCNVLADGGSAFIMTTGDNARRVCKKPVYILAEASDFSHRQITKAKISDIGWDKWYGPVAKEVYKIAGLEPKDMDIYELYGAYAWCHLLLMDSVGICEPGNSGALVESGATGPGGKYPTSTNGEAFGFGHTGTGVGFGVFVESVRQLQGKAGKAQVPNAKFLIKSSEGGGYMDIHWTIMGNEIP